MMPFTITLAEGAVAPLEFTWENAVEIVVIIAAGTAVLYVLLAMLQRLAVPRLLEGPMRTAVKWMGILLIAATVLQRFNIPVYTILAATLALVAVGFVATWSVLCNFLCSFLLVILKPFAVNDWVEFPGERIGGKVTDLTLLYTVLRDEDGQLFQVPNCLFFQKTIKRVIATSGTDLSHSLQANTSKLGATSSSANAVQSTVIPPVNRT